MADRRFPAAGIEALLTDIFAAAGGARDEAAAIAGNLVDASLTGHDSHGIVRTARYCEWAAAGILRFGAQVETVVDAPAFALLDGGRGFGQVIGRQAVEIGLAKAREAGVAVVGLRRSGHLGRIGAWAEMACAVGFVSIHFVNVQNSLLVAPFGGAKRRMSTAPVCVGVPDRAGDFILDFATSEIAEGKALVAVKGKHRAPPGALIDPEGVPTDDPAVLYGETALTPVPNPRSGPGALAPMGRHKGSGLAIACELLAGALTGSGAGADEAEVHNGMLSIYVDPLRLSDGHDWAGEVHDYMAFVRGCPPGPGVGAVLVPGDPERQRRAERLQGGLPVTEGVWQSILEAGVQLGLDRAAMEARVAEGA